MNFGTRDHLDEKNGHLTIGGADVIDLTQEYGTPLYVIDEGAFGVTTDALQQRSQTRTSTMPLRQTATSQCCACLPKRVPALTFSLMVSFMPLFLQASSLTEFSSMGTQKLMLNFAWRAKPAFEFLSIHLRN